MVSSSTASFPPNKSFKPTPHRGVNSVLCATLHAVAAPLRGGLTQALGGKKHSAVELSVLQLIGFGQHCSSGCSSARCFFGQVHLARSRTAFVAFAGFGSGAWLALRFSAPDAVASETAGCEFAGAPWHPGFGSRQARHSFTLAGIRPA